MRIPDDRADCCPVYVNLPENVDCFQADINQEWNKLKRRHQRMFTRRKRLLCLAQPKNVYKRFVRTCACKYRKPIQIVREENEAHLRTQQLAIPPVRRLLLFKERVKNLFYPNRILFINGLIRAGLFSLYARLQNEQPPQKKEKIHKWDDEEWKTHTKYLKKLSKPKKQLKPPKIPKQHKNIEEMTQFQKLAIPKIRVEPVQEPWKLTKAAKAYKASPRLQELAKSKIYDDSAITQELPIPISPNALAYKASTRIKDLATPREKGVNESDLKENPYSIAPNALKAKASARIKEMAEPKEYQDTHTREIPWPISPAALKHKASPRLLELAQPKGS